MENITNNKIIDVNTALKDLQTYQTQLDNINEKIRTIAKPLNELKKEKAILTLDLYKLNIENKDIERKCYHLEVKIKILKNNNFKMSAAQINMEENIQKHEAIKLEKTHTEVGINNTEHEEIEDNLLATIASNKALIHMRINNTID